MNNRINNNSGFTLMELLVAMTVFLVVIGLSSGIFIQTLRTQRTITKFSESMNNVTLALEQIAREVRTGFDFPVVDGRVEPNVLKFRNGYGEHVSYTLIGDGLVGRCMSFQAAGCQITTDASDFSPITSPDVQLQSLRFVVQNDINRPPLVTVAAEVSIGQGATLTMQTSVSTRIID